MADKKSTDTWGTRVAGRIGAQVKAIRNARGMSAQKLADTTRDLGHELKRSVIANLESGRRDYVTVPDLFVLSRALDVPPMVLLSSPDDDGGVEPIPGQRITPWRTISWIEGSIALEGSDAERWRSAAQALQERRRYEVWTHERERALARASARSERAATAASEAEADLLRSEARRELEQADTLERTMADMAERLTALGLEPPVNLGGVPREVLNGWRASVPE